MAWQCPKCKAKWSKRAFAEPFVRDKPKCPVDEVPLVRIEETK
jgi:hypothetical protein